MGGFTTNSATWLAHDHPQEEPPWPFKRIWKVDTMPKIKIFLCQMCHNALPIRGSLLRQGCHIEPQCPLYLNEIETSNHVFGSCPQTNIAWDLAKLHSWIPLQTSINQSIDWLSTFETFIVTSNEKILQRISFLLCSISNMRNAVTFQQEFFQPIKCLFWAKKLSAEWRIRTCMSVDEFFQGACFTPSHKLQIIR